MRARIEKDQLNARAFHAVSLRIVNPAARSWRNVDLPKLSKQFLGSRRPLEFCTGIIAAIVVIVPSCEKWKRLPRLCKVGMPRLRLVGIRQFGQRRSGNVAVNIIAHHEKHLRPRHDSEHITPNRLWMTLRETRAKRNARELRV